MVKMYTHTLRYSGLTAKCTYSDLNEEVSQMFLKCRNVLVEAEQTLDE